MAIGNNPNLPLLELAIHRLGRLTDEFVFLGGCVTGLLIEDEAAPPIRETIDVDVIVQVLSKGEYYALAERLRESGFSEDTGDDAPVCRWIHPPVVLDVMPVEPEVLGFGNPWYKPAMEHAETMTLPDGRPIRVVSPAYFLITKLEAFHGRGDGDYQMSHDLEDVVAVIDGRPGIVDDIARSPDDVRAALAAAFGNLLADSRFVDAVYGHMPTDDISQQRVPLVLSRMRRIVGFA